MSCTCWTKLFWDGWMIFIFHGDITIPECPAVYISIYTHTHTHTHTHTNCLWWASSITLSTFTAKQYPLKAVHMREKKEKKRKKKTVSPFRENLLGSIRPFPGLIKFFMPGAISHMGSPWKQGCITIGVNSEGVEPGKFRFCFWLPARLVSPKESSSVAQWWCWLEIQNLPIWLQHNPIPRHWSLAQGTTKTKFDIRTVLASWTGLVIKNKCLFRLNSFATHSYGDMPLLSGASHMTDCT